VNNGQKLLPASRTDRFGTINLNIASSTIASSIPSLMLANRVFADGLLKHSKPRISWAKEKYVSSD